MSNENVVQDPVEDHGEAQSQADVDAVEAEVADLRRQ